MSGTAPVVIGLAGGIGSGKSTVAAMLAEHGCIVADSDLQARRTLERPEVRDELVRWWGPGVAKPDGTIDRARIAAIVFTDPAERRRLEGLVHPLIREGRRELITRAIEAGAPAVVVDAPLLFEAGVDRECDVVVFVEAPLADRLARIRARGWDARELARRENAQWPLEDKRRLADEVIVNDAGEGALRARVAALFQKIVCNTP